MIKYPSIRQFREIVKEVKFHNDYKGKDENEKPVYCHTTPYPTIVFRGTVKMHGTNSAVVKYKDRIEFQSRENVLSLGQDNCNFMREMLNKDLDFLFEGIEFNDHIAVFGEWCGQGVQSGVAISQLPKMFVIFGYKVDGEWLHICRNHNIQNIYSINQFYTPSIIIDFNYPERSQNELVELTEAVEKECPIAKTFGISGVGEGIVWTGTNSVTGQSYKFKVKGEKHSATKVKTLASVDVEMITSVKQFADAVLTESRLEQGISWLQENHHPLDQTSTGIYLKWLIGDVLKEEQDTIVDNQLDVKKIGGAISNQARVWWFDKLNQLAFQQ